MFSFAQRCKSILVKTERSLLLVPSVACAGGYVASTAVGEQSLYQNPSHLDIWLLPHQD